jgi:transcriptional regulator with XRE-family HTH domain
MIAIMAISDLEIGPVGRRIAANIAALRRNRGLTQAELASRMNDIGRPMSGPVVSKTEKLDRRTDVDDLVALAVALHTTPNRLLLADPSEHPDAIDLAPTGACVEMRQAWEWATGRLPLSLRVHITPGWKPKGRYAEELASTDDDVDARIEKQLRQFYQENWPYYAEDTNGADLAAAMKELDNHPNILKQAMKLVETANKEGMTGLHSLIAAVDLANFFVENNALANEEVAEL